MGEMTRKTARPLPVVSCQLPEKSGEALFALATGNWPLATDWKDDELQSIFQHQLAAPLAVDLARFSPDMAQTCPISTLETFGQLLNHPSPPLEALRKVKDFAKFSRTDPDAPLPPEIATVLYFAAITAARLRHGQRITELDDATLVQSLDWCATRPWIDECTQRLFKDALAKLPRIVA
jgi:hypothetical protein